MKKKTVFAALVLLVLLVIGSLPVSAADNTVSGAGVELRFLECQLNDFAEKPSLFLFVHGINNTDRTIWINTKDITVDGTPVSSAGRSLDPHSDTGEDNPKIITIMGSTEDGGAGYAAIRNAHTLEMNVLLEDSSTYEHLYEQHVSLDLAALNNASAEDPSPESYRTLQRGDKGDDVKRLQEKLIELGYLSDTADGSFGPKTAAAVQRFNEANGLRSDDIADGITQDCMFSGLANPYTEPWIPVELPRTEWDNVTGDGASYRVLVTNTSQTRTIKGIELQYYVTDVWGERLWDYDHRNATFPMTIPPGESVYTNWLYISPSWYNIDMIYWGVSRIVFDDGTIRENDDMTYWTISLH